MDKKFVSDIFAEQGLVRSYNKLIFRGKKREYMRRESIGNGGKQSVAHVTYCVAGNSGDTVLSQCVRRTFSSQIKLSGWDIIPVNKSVSSDTIDEINRCGMLVIGGGGLFLPDTNENSISGWQWAIPRELLQQIKVPICVYSVGYNYFRGQESNSLFRDSLMELADKSSFFGLRNTGSLHAIQNLLPAELSNKAVYQPCTTTLIRKLYGDSLPIKKETGNIAINMAFDREQLRYGKKREEILSQVANAIKTIEERGYHIYYVCHCWEDDRFLPFLKEYGVKYQLVDLSRKYPEDVYKFYSEIDLVLGMRGHAQMIPFGMNCEIISLGTHDKLKWFLDDINADDWYVDLTSNIGKISDNIMETFVRIHEIEKELTKARLVKEQEKLWNISMNNIRTIQETIENG